MSMDRPDYPEWGDEPDRPERRDLPTGGGDERWDPIVACDKRLSEFELPEDEPDADLEQYLERFQPECRNVEVPPWRRDVLLYGNPDNPTKAATCMASAGLPGRSSPPIGMRERSFRRWNQWRVNRSISTPVSIRVIGGSTANTTACRSIGTIHASGHVRDAWPVDGPGVGFNEDPAYDGKIWE